MLTQQHPPPTGNLDAQPRIAVDSDQLPLPIHGTVSHHRRTREVIIIEQPPIHPYSLPNPPLAPGVTTPRIDAAVYAVWISVVHRVARETGATLAAAVDLPTVGRNHYRVRSTTADGARLRLLLNATALLVAAADDTDPDALIAPFRTVPGSDLYTAAGLHVAAPADLERPLTDHDTTALTQAEREDIAYHHPARIGDALFNWFD